MNHSQQPPKPSRRNRGLIGSFDDLVLAEKADKGPGEILPSATSDHGEDGSHHRRQFLDGKPKEEVSEGFKPVPHSVNEAVDSVRRPSSPNGKVVSALRPNTSVSSSSLRPRTEQQSRTVRPASKMVAPQNQPKVTPQASQSLPVATPVGPKHDAPAVRTRLSQPKRDTSTSHGQKRLPSTTPPRPNLDTLVVSTVKSSQPKPDTPTPPKPNTPTSRGQKSLPSVTPPRLAPTVSTVHSSRSDFDTPPLHGENSPRSISVADDHSQSTVVPTPTRRRASPSSSSASASHGRVTVQCGATNMSNEPCSQSVMLPPTHALLDSMPAALLSP
ncbi:hypothetical protein F5141DRAFT_1079875 [Pisolithus sp. B1]|nr:hypothetical protein F5141DRAFT_1079875 [Pisolithus sp. B1]